VARYFEPFWAKLKVVAKDAVPISVVNFRSAASSAEAQQVERQLTALVIERLTRERTIFVLERRRIELLAREKEFDLDDSEFWSGAYLLEGVLDPQSYSKGTLTVSARLVPPEGGLPLVFEVGGLRTNLADVVDRVVAGVVSAIKLSPTVTEWNASEEARQFFAEATWALRWKMYPEAQAAAESAWALGKRDLECALVRIRAYVDEVPGILPTNVMRFHAGKPDLRYVRIAEPLNSRFCDNALCALQYYYEFCRTYPEGMRMTITPGPDTHTGSYSDWYRLGLDVLEAATRILQYYYFRPDARAQVADKLPELRALACQVADLIANEPSVRESYFVGDRLVPYDELADTIGTSPNIFDCMVRCGCFWQERPEDTVALYRRLMSSPVFCYIHTAFWFRESLQPRFVAWNETEERSIPLVAEAFLNELSNSTNPLLRLEAKALRLADARTDTAAVRAFNDLFDTMTQNRDVFVTNNVDLLYMNWWVGELLNQFQDGISVATRDRLRARYNTEYRPVMEEWHEEVSRRITEARMTQLAVGLLKHVITEDKPLNAMGFYVTGSELHGSSQHAGELRPLLATYKSNLTHKTQGLTGAEKAKMQSKIQQAELWEKMIEQIAAAPEPRRQLVATRSGRPSGADLGQVGRPAPAAPNKLHTAPLAAPKTVLTVTNYIPFPVERLKAGKLEESIRELKLELLGARDGRLWFCVRFARLYLVYHERGSRWEGDARVLVAGLNLQDFSWELVPFPARQERIDSVFMCHPSTLNLPVTFCSSVAWTMFNVTTSDQADGKRSVYHGKSHPGFLQFRADFLQLMKKQFSRYSMAVGT